MTLTNSGGSDFTGFDFTENVPAGATLTGVSGASGFVAPVAGAGSVGLSVATVPANGTATVTVTFKVDDPIAGGISEIANVISGGDIDPGCLTCTVTVPTSAKVTVDKQLTGESGSQAGIAEPGEVLTYTITLTNAGGSDFNNFAFTEQVPAGATLTAVTGAGGFTAAVAGPGALALQVAKIPANDVEVVTVTFTVSDPLPPGLSEIANTVSGGNIDPGCTTCTVTVPTSAKVTVDKQLTGESGIQAGFAEPGEVLTYTITLSNDGGSDFNNFDFNELVPAGATLTGVTGATGFGGPLAGPAALPLQVATIPANDIAVVVVTFTVDDPLPAGITEIANVVSGGDVDPGCTTCLVTLPTPQPDLKLEKTGRYEDTDGSGNTTEGDTLTFTFVVTNTGNVPLTGVTPVDPGPEFNGQRAANALSAMSPVSVTLNPGESQTFTGTYPLGQADIANAAGIQDGVNNTARAQGFLVGAPLMTAPVESNQSVALLALPSVEAPTIGVVKQALLRHIRRGEVAPYAILLTNDTNGAVAGVTVTDTLPSGFRYVEGSATVDGVGVVPTVNGLRVTFEGLTLPANSVTTLRLEAQALSSAGPGKHVNRAIATDATGQPLSAEAQAMVEILAEPVFDCGEIIGTVFDDINRNGYQDEGEPGLPGVRIATVKGWLVTTDKHGRFHVPCAALPDQRIGSNFIMKLDTRTLPSGYRLTTENPRVVRLTAGKMTKLNFGASIGRVVRLDLTEDAFETGGKDLRQEWGRGVDQLLAVLAKEESVLRLSYVGADADQKLARDRVEKLKQRIADAWKTKGAGYKLEIETRMELGQ